VDSLQTHPALRDVVGYEAYSKRDAGLFDRPYSGGGTKAATHDAHMVEET